MPPRLVAQSKHELADDDPPRLAWLARAAHLENEETSEVISADSVGARAA